VVSRTIGTSLIFLPLLLTRRLRLSRAALPLVVVAGLLEVFGGAVYVIGAADEVAIAAVVSSQFAAIAAVGGYLLFGERLQRIQLVGVVTVVAAVTLLSAVQA
jgi:drug/metabolite transporter (DMT)-like permease